MEPRWEKGEGERDLTREKLKPRSYLWNTNIEQRNKERAFSDARRIESTRVVTSLFDDVPVVVFQFAGFRAKRTSQFFWRSINNTGILRLLNWIPPRRSFPRCFRPAEILSLSLSLYNLIPLSQMHRHARERWKSKSRSNRFANSRNSRFIYSVENEFSFSVFRGTSLGWLEYDVYGVLW